VGLGTSGTQTLIYGFVANYYPTRVRAAGVAWCAGFGRLGGIGGPVLGSAMIGAGLQLNAIFDVLAGIAVVGAVLTVLVPMARSQIARRAPMRPAIATNHSSARSCLRDGRRSGEGRHQHRLHHAAVLLFGGRGREVAGETGDQAHVERKTVVDRHSGRRAQPVHERWRQTLAIHRVVQPPEHASAPCHVVIAHERQPLGIELRHLRAEFPAGVAEHEGGVRDPRRTEQAQVLALKGPRQRAPLRRAVQRIECVKQRSHFRPAVGSGRQGHGARSGAVGRGSTRERLRRRGDVPLTRVKRSGRAARRFVPSHAVYRALPSASFRSQAIAVRDEA